MKVLLALALVCAVALAQVTTIDNFTVDQDPLSVNGPAPSASTTANDAGIYGGRRTTTLDLAAASVSTCRTGLSSTTNISPTGFLDANADGVNDNPGDLGIFIAANDQSCFAKAVLSYQGTGAALTGADRNLNNIGAAFHIRYYSDLGARQLLLKVNTGVSTCSATLTTTGSQQVDDKTIPFGSFSTGCDFSNADSIQIEVPAQSNFDVTISIFEFVAASLSGRVYNDCACDNTFNGNDSPVAGQTVTATPGNNCGGAPTKTTSTDGTGNYRFTGLATCSYTISISATTCSNSPSSQTRTTSISAEVTNVNFALPVASTLTPPGPVTYECNEPIATSQATLTSQCGTTAVTTFTETTTTQAVCASNGNPAVNRVITRTFSAAGQTATQTITVITDRQAPSYTNPADATITCQQFPSDPNTTPIPTSLSGAPAMTDNCSTPSFTFVDSITQVCDTTICGSSFNIIRTFSVRDSCGNGPVSSGTQRITRGACSSTGSFICPIQSVCGVNPPPPPPPNVPPPPPQTGECNGNTNSRTTNTLSQDVTIPTNSLTTVEITNSRSTLTSDDITNASLLTNSRTTLTTAENVAGNTNTKTTITSDDFTGASLATNSRTSLTNSENLAGSPTPNTSNDSPLAVDSSANSPNESPANSNSGSPANSNSGNNSPNNSNSNNNSNSGNNNNSSNNSSATSLAASLVALVALFFLF